MITQYDLYETPSPKGEDGKKIAACPCLSGKRLTPVKSS